MPDWFETLADSFWLLPDEQGEEEARFIHKALHLRKGQKVLDAPSGAGRVAVHVASTGVSSLAPICGKVSSRARARGFGLRELPANLSLSTCAESDSRQNLTRCTIGVAVSGTSRRTRISS